MRDPASNEYTDLLQALRRSLLGGGVKPAAYALGVSDEAVYHHADGQSFSPFHKVQDVLDALVLTKGRSGDEGRDEALAVLHHWNRRYLGKTGDEITAADANQRLGKIYAAAGTLGVEMEQALRDNRIDETERPALRRRAEALATALRHLQVALDEPEVVAS